MSNTNKSSFESAITYLIKADPKNNAKGDALKNWVREAFDCEARVSHTTEDKALGNRVSEQFRHKAPIVVFVCREGLNLTTLRGHIDSHAYAELDSVLIMYDKEPYQYFKLLEYRENGFSQWAAQTLGVEIEHLDEIKNTDVQSVLEPSIANYLTKHDDEDLSSEDLVKLFHRAYNESKKGEQGTIANLFGILYAPHIENIPKNGENSIAEMALGKGGYGSMGDEIGRGISIGLELRKHIQKQNNLFKEVSRMTSTPTNYDKYLRALRTKPFMLLAGISGTGKSRIVRELAFKSCPPYLRDADGTTPGNYLMVEVKPNWHDSSELLGYYSHLANNGNGGYVFTPFTKFLVKAMMFPNVPFFVCLDEMNLAPVEQYFAEFLSVLETRKHDKDNYIQTGVLVKPEYFQGISDHVGDGYICTEFFPDGLPKIDYPVYTNTILTNKGLSLPDNVFIIGTVNMDDTTHQFSRKVIDRAMTIEMNGGKLTEMFGHSADLEYLPADQVWELEKFLPQYVNADEVVAAHPEYEWLIQTQLPAILEDINDVLRDTPFQVSYRVLNEMVIYFSVLVESGMPSEEAKNLAVDQMLLMKILPRIEGDRDMLMLDAQTCRLDKLEPFATSEETKKKIAEMKNRLNKQEFTRFWP